MSAEAKPRCVHTKPDGERCRVQFGLNPDNGKCFQHDPTRKEERRAAQQKGAREKNRRDRAESVRPALPDEAPPPPETYDDAVRWTSWATHAVATGKIDGRTAHEIGYMLRAFFTGLDKADTSERLKEVREQLEEVKAS